MRIFSFIPSPFPLSLSLSLHTPFNVMPELIRSMIGSLREFFGNRRRARRYRLRVPFRVSLFDPKLTHAQLERAPHLAGVTCDISASGLALAVPAIRIKDRYLTASEQTLRLILEFPSGLVEMRVAPVRYQQLDGEDAPGDYLIGVRIAEISEDDRALFDDHLKD